MKLSDFGLVHCKAHASDTWAEGSVSTIGYRSPEMLIGFPFGHIPVCMAQLQSDVWAMCCTAVEWFTGQFPWTLQETQDPKKQIKMKQESQSPPDGLSNVPERVRQRLSSGLEYNPGNRPSAQRMVEKMGVF